MRTTHLLWTGTAAALPRQEVLTPHRQNRAGPGTRGPGPTRRGSPGGHRSERLDTRLPARFHPSGPAPAIVRGRERAGMPSVDAGHRSGPVPAVGSGWTWRGSPRADSAPWSSHPACPRVRGTSARAGLHTPTRSTHRRRTSAGRTGPRSACRSGSCRRSRRQGSSRRRGSAPPRSGRGSRRTAWSRPASGRRRSPRALPDGRWTVFRGCCRALCTSS